MTHISASKIQVRETIAMQMQSAAVFQRKALTLGQENRDLVLLTSQGDAFAASEVLEVLPMPDVLGERPHRQVMRAGQDAALYSASLPKRQISSCSSSLMNKKCS